MCSSFAYRPVVFIRHLTPRFRPLWLGPLLKIIETVRIRVRPITLALRLRIKMSTGHIFISLIRGGLVGLLWSHSLGFLLVLLILGGYYLFEGAICLIQGFVFCLLIGQYQDEHC